jgi:ribosomal-protein-alanine N-acetyltransferase
MMSHSRVSLRPTNQARLATLFRFQLGPQAAYLAAFMPKDSTDKAAYLERFTRFLHDPTIHMQTILVAGIIAGSIAKYELAGQAVSFSSS